MDNILTVRIPGVFEELSVLGNIAGKQHLYRSRLVDRMGVPSDSDTVNGPLYFLSEPGCVSVRDDVAGEWRELDFSDASARDAGLQAAPVFFESRYVFRGRCASQVKEVRIYHRLASVTDGFTYCDGWLFGDIDFINTPGRFALSLDVFFKDGSKRRIVFRFTVVSVKMNVEDDYKDMLGRIEKERRGLVQNFLAK